MYIDRLLDLSTGKPGGLTTTDADPSQMPVCDISHRYYGDAVSCLLDNPGQRIDTRRQLFALRVGCGSRSAPAGARFWAHRWAAKFLPPKAVESNGQGLAEHRTHADG